MGNIGPVQLLIVLAIIVLLFGTKKLRNIGSDLGSAIKGFKKSVSDDKEESKEPEKLSETIQKSEEAPVTKAETKEKDQA